MVEEDATAVSVQMQSGMELDISRKHAAPKPNPPNAGPGHCKWQIMEGMAVCPLPCVVVSDLPPSTLPFWPPSYGIMFDFEADDAAERAGLKIVACR
jgi:hypothetical protein